MPAVTLISSLPTFVSTEEHATITGSTPGSFADIPAVLKHKEENVAVSLEPALEAFGTSQTQGTLYVLTSVLVFMPTTGSQGFQIEYPAITLHAVSRGESGPSLYCQLDETYGGAAAPVNRTTSRDEEAEEEDSDMRELTVIPQNHASVQTIFEALSQCASLHPDPLDDDLAEDDTFIDSSNFETFNGDESEELSEVGRVALEYMESIIADPHNLIPQENDHQDTVKQEGTVEHDVDEQSQS